MVNGLGSLVKGVEGICVEGDKEGSGGGIEMHLWKWTRGVKIFPSYGDAYQRASDTEEAFNNQADGPVDVSQPLASPSRAQEKSNHHRSTDGGQ